jgi:hypothetical protein
MPWAARANRAPVANWQPLGSPRTNRADFSLEDDEVSEAQTRDFTQSIVGGGRRRDSGQTSRSAEVCKVDTAYSQATFTPNFPAYPSGHATFGAACFDALRLYRKSHLRKAAPDQIDITFVSDERTASRSTTSRTA